MRVADGIICSTGFLARRYRSFNQRTWECRNGIDLKRYDQPQAGAPGRDDRLGRRRRPQGVARALGARAPQRAARAPRGALRVRRPRRRRRRSSRSSARARDRLPERRDRGLPGDDDAVRHLDRAVGREQPVPRQERPALARGERARHPARRPPRGLSGHRGRRHRRARLDAGRGRGGAAAADRRRRASASGSARTAHEHVAEHRRIEVMAESWREVLDEVRAPVGAA